MSPVVKICGLSDIETIDAAIDAGADMVGLVFFARSPRFVTVDEAEKLAERARDRAEIVALTVDMADAELAGIIERIRPDWIQLHGAESPGRVAAIRDRFPAKVMKAIGIRERADLAAVTDAAGVADRLLLDAKPPRGSERTGGHGVAFDWSLLDGFDPGMPWMLSGGLDPHNVAAAIARTGAPGVDVSSGVETEPGRKDPDRIRAFVAAARAATEAMPETVAS